MFGPSQENVIIDNIILMTKKVIYRNRIKGKISHLNEIKYHIFLQMKLEEYFAEVEEIVDNFRSKCRYLYEEFDSFLMCIK